MFPPHAYNCMHDDDRDLKKVFLHCAKCRLTGRLAGVGNLSNADRSSSSSSSSSLLYRSGGTLIMWTVYMTHTHILTKRRARDSLRQIVAAHFAFPKWMQIHISHSDGAAARVLKGPYIILLPTNQPTNQPASQPAIVCALQILTTCQRMLILRKFYGKFNLQPPPIHQSSSPRIEHQKNIINNYLWFCCCAFLFGSQISMSQHT